jgi:hypothetical protein
MARRDMAEQHRHVRAVIPARAVRAAAVSAPPGETSEPAVSKPQIELVREGGVVRAIDVICGCGERLRIVCEYDA